MKAPVDRAGAARWLTERLESAPAQLFLRLGDGELAFLLACQSGALDAEVITARRPSSLDGAQSLPGLLPEDAPPLLAAYEAADIVDCYDHVPYSKKHYADLRWSPKSEQTQLHVSEGSGLLFTWALHELPGYLARHRCIFCGSEAPLLEALLRDPRYLAVAARWWGDAQPATFVTPPEDGRNIRAHRDELLARLEQAVRQSGADTVFLSLGGAAKIIAPALARASGVSVFDFGSALRALTYSASEGHATWRSAHNPFLFRVPLPVQLDALAVAYPGRSSGWLARKAAMQVCLELERKTEGESLTSEAFDPAIFSRDPASMAAFSEAYRHYTAWIRHLPSDTEVGESDRELRHWLRSHGIGWSGFVWLQTKPLRALARRTISLLATRRQQR
jgi:hypothetical protein